MSCEALQLTGITRPLLGRQSLFRLSIAVFLSLGLLFSSMTPADAKRRHHGRVAGIIIGSIVAGAILSDRHHRYRHRRYYSRRCYRRKRCHWYRRCWTDRYGYEVCSRRKYKRCYRRRYCN